VDECIRFDSYAIRYDRIRIETYAFDKDDCQVDECIRYDAMDGWMDGRVSECSHDSCEQGART
jgi:hypothetical protein